ncbi:SPX-domain-containing protein [Eremomyces bilateralis CBS 781.70]|uniref:SPX-domain-containing protein n=1 Tax=Eremomyces bilateralis CBS 781.70 TaxID=1392243 RepID=A0A6G1FWS4_9PEZI|nr:SPX-domain-containing protein [Eremomyces bilateralis CBS 781.70]KAF1810152.1 SPX-domain-containing protein [Eremomyces bilateralis CBS 781.70]
MRFGRQLRSQTYKPWEDKYIDYDKLKKLLKEPGSDVGSDNEDDGKWTDQDEEDFVEELVNVQLEKVNTFSTEISQNLKDRSAKCEERLYPLGWVSKGEHHAEPGREDKGKVPEEERKDILEDVLKELDSITNELSELEKYARINYTGFLKAVKKHDRKRGQSYRVRPLLQVRLSALPFYTEDYSSLLYHLSVLYSFIRESLEGKAAGGVQSADEQVGGQSSQSYKFWVHPDNLLEVKTIILRRLPVLIYNPQTSKVADGAKNDPTLTSVYFDNPKFSLYSSKISQENGPASLRLRWYGHLADKPDIFVEKKIMRDNNTSEETRFRIKEKYVQPFISGEYHMEKSIDRLKQRVGDDSEQVTQLEHSVEEIQSFIKEQSLQPVLRANYSRTAYEVPGDHRIRISLDTDLSFIREDAIDHDRPCRDPSDWHRGDIDANQMEYPFSQIRKGEIDRFPFAVLEIKIKGGQKYEWLNDLMDSHLVTSAPRFSKFVHGVALLFEDYVNTFPFWLSALETDIRRDPQEAFHEALKRRQREAENEHAIGSLFGPGRSPSAFQPGTISPASSIPKSTPTKVHPSSSAISHTSLAQMTRAAAAENAGPDRAFTIDEADSDDEDRAPGDGHGRRFMHFLVPSFSTSKYARWQRRREKQPRLPPGVSQPEVWLKDKGPVQVEAKVWLANQRTFIKWQNVSVLLASLSLGLYNAAGESNTVARALAIVYTLLAVFAGVWGWAVYQYRSLLIYNRSGKDLDVVWGPMVVCFGLAAALLLNFGLKYRNLADNNNPDQNNSTLLLQPILQHSSLLNQEL